MIQKKYSRFYFLRIALFVPAVVGIFICFPKTASATVDYLAANHVTKQLHVFDEDDYEGAFWEVLAGEDFLWRAEEGKYLGLGYTFTDSPYTLDWAALFSLFATAVAFLTVRTIRKWKQRKKEAVTIHLSADSADSQYYMDTP